MNRFVVSALALLLIVSGAGNLVLSRRTAESRPTADAPAPVQASIAASNFSESELRELAVLRNEVRQLREEAVSNRMPVAPEKQESARTGNEVNYLRATQLLAHLEKDYQRVLNDSRDLEAELVAASPERLVELQRMAQSNRCIGNLKHIGLAARIWANQHGGQFPPDFTAMRDELEAKYLICPAASSTKPTWEEIDLTTVAYRLLNANGNDSDPQKPLATCPLHNNVGLSDGSAWKPTQAAK